MPTSKNGTQIDPTTKAVMPGLGWAFQFLVDGEYQSSARWWVSDPDIGAVKNGEFWSHKGFRIPSAKVHAQSSDGKHQAQADVAVTVGPPPTDGPFFVDDFKIPFRIESVRWNDAKGRRAALLMLEALMQLPDQFLGAVGPVEIVRAQNIGTVGGRPIEGQHLPFLSRAVLLSEALVSKLEVVPGVTDADRYFVRTFVHELAHVALANMALSDIDRINMLGVSALGLVGAPTSLVLLAVPVGYIYALYFSPVSQRDICSDYAKVTGWVINNPNPFTFLWNDTTALPNVVTGLSLFGRSVGLRNLKAPRIPIPLPPGSWQPDVDDYYRKAGFPSAYAGVDVHEDWAESIAAMAVHEPIMHDPKFQDRRRFIEKSGVWPRSAAPVEPGRILNAWSLAHRGSPTDLTQWAVDFGLWSGRARYPAPIPLPPKSLRRAASRASGQKTMAAARVESEGAGDSVDSDSRSWLGEGYGQKYTHAGELAKDVGKILPLLEVPGLDDGIGKRLEAPLRVVGTVLREILDDVPQELTWDLPCGAEKHGQGLRLIGKGEVTLVNGVATIVDFAARPGDLVWAEGGSFFVIVETDERGGIRAVTGDPRIEEDGRVRALEVDPRRWRYVWRPDPAVRRWTRDHSTGFYADLEMAMAGSIDLWGKTKGTRGRNLSSPGGFLAELFSIAGVPARGLSGKDDEDVVIFLGKFGAGPVKIPLKGAAGVELQPGDVVRFRRFLWWGVITRAMPDTETCDAVVQGGRRGLLGEEEGAVTLWHREERKKLDLVWRPSMQRRDGA